MKEFITAEPVVLPRRFADAELDDKTNAVLKEIASKYIEKFDKYYDQGIAPSFFGTAGTGKTHVAAAIARKLNERGVIVYWVDTVHYLNKLMDYKDLRRGNEYFRLKRTTATTPLVIIDDFGHLQKYQRTHELFFELVNSRYSNKLATIFTANFTDPFKSIGDIFTPALSRRIKLMSEGLVYVV